MLKIFSLAIAVTIGAFAIVPNAAFAGDHGPCDHCTMEPIVVKGERPKKKAQTQTRQLRADNPSTPIIIQP